MKTPVLGRGESATLLAVALVGLVGPNGAFLCFSLAEPNLLDSFLSHPLALAFLAETVGLMLLGCWLLRRTGAEIPTVLAFVLLSLLGSLLFSVPLFLRGRVGRYGEAEPSRFPESA